MKAIEVAARLPCIKGPTFWTSNFIPGFFFTFKYLPFQEMPVAEILIQVSIDANSCLGNAHEDARFSNACTPSDLVHHKARNCDKDQLKESNHNDAILGVNTSIALSENVGHELHDDCSSAELANKSEPSHKTNGFQVLDAEMR